MFQTEHSLTIAAQLLQKHTQQQQQQQQTKEDTATNPDANNEQHLHPFTLDRSCSLLYNMALSLLLRGKEKLAFASLQTSLLLLYHQPSLWLRLGECCVVHYLRKKRKAIREKKQTSKTHALIPATLSTSYLTDEKISQYESEDPNVQTHQQQQRQDIPADVFLEQVSTGKTKAGKIFISEAPFEVTDDTQASLEVVFAA